MEAADWTRVKVKPVNSSSSSDLHDETCDSLAPPVGLNSAAVFYFETRKFKYYSHQYIYKATEQLSISWLADRFYS